MIFFNDIEIVFWYKLNKVLKKVYFLFNIFVYLGLVKVGKGLINFGFFFYLLINGIICVMIFEQFCGGEIIEECFCIVQEMWKNYVGIIFDYFVEGKILEEDFEKIICEIIVMIIKGKGNFVILFVVFKVIGIMCFGLLEKVNFENVVLNEKEQQELMDFWECVYCICQVVYDVDVLLFIDVEESWIQDIIDCFIYGMMLEFNKEKVIVYNILQMYWYDCLEFLKKEVVLVKKDGVYYGIKLVCGVYMEKE